MSKKQRPIITIEEDLAEYKKLSKGIVAFKDVVEKIESEDAICISIHSGGKSVAYNINGIDDAHLIKSLLDTVKQRIQYHKEAQQVILDRLSKDI